MSWQEVEHDGHIDSCRRLLLLLVPAHTAAELVDDGDVQAP